MVLVVFIGIIIFLIWGHSLSKSKHTPTSFVSSSEHAIEHSKTMASHFCELASKAADEGRHIEAIQHYNNAISYNKIAIFYNNRAFSKSKINYFTDAIEDYDKAIKLAPENAIYIANRGMLFYNNNRADLAYNDWKKATELGSTNAKEWLQKYFKKPEYKKDWQEFKNILNTHNINSLFHFTDRANLKSIESHGALFSWDYCLTKNIIIPSPGGSQLSRDLDTSKGLQNYVRVSFTRSHPMMFASPTKERDNVILEIDPEVIFWLHTKYANKNATRNDVNVGATLSDFKKIKFEIVKLRNHFNLNETDKPFYQGEILVLEKIPAQYIRNLRNFKTLEDKYDDLPF